VDSLDTYRKLARSLPREKFVARFNHPFLVKRPLVKPVDDPTFDDAWDDRFSFRTKVYEDVEETDLEDEFGPSAHEWRVVEVRKREGNPFPERISVGRAKNCDVVLRFPSVSKLHAHFLVRAGDPVYRIVDQQSANGTRVAGRVVAVADGVALNHGDVIRFGVLDLEFIDAGRFYTILASTGG
jgi:hypothetical protein